MTATDLPVSAYDLIRGQALVAIEDRDLDPAQDVDQVRDVVAGLVADYQRSAYSGADRPPLRDPADMTARVVSAISEFGAFTGLLARTDIQEIFIEGPRVDYKDESGRLQGLGEPTTLEENLQFVQQLLASTNRRLDSSNPIVQARVLHNTARLTALIEPVAEGICATIRRYTLRRQTLASLVDSGSLTTSAASFLNAVMKSPTPRVVVSGRIGAGKTSMLSALLSAAPTDRVIRVCEAVREIHVPLPHASFWEAQEPGLSGTGGVSLRALVQTALAMAAEMIVIGEVRGAEAYEIAQAMNAGAGFGVTVHANSARDALGSLLFNASKAGERVPEAALRNRFADSIDYVVHCDISDTTAKVSNEPALRQVTEIVAVSPSYGTDTFVTEPIFQRAELGAPLVWTGDLPAVAVAVERSLPPGVSLGGILDGHTVYL